MALAANLIGVLALGYLIWRSLRMQSDVLADLEDRHRNDRSSE